MGCTASKVNEPLQKNSDQHENSPKVVVPGIVIPHIDDIDETDTGLNTERVKLRPLAPIPQPTRNNQKVLYSSSATTLTNDRMEQLKNITCYRCLRRFNQQTRKPI